MNIQLFILALNPCYFSLLSLSLKSFSRSCYCYIALPSIKLCFLWIYLQCFTCWCNTYTLQRHISVTVHSREIKRFANACYYKVYVKQCKIKQRTTHIDNMSIHPYRCFLRIYVGRYYKCKGIFDGSTNWTRINNLVYRCPHSVVRFYLITDMMSTIHRMNISKPFFGKKCFC